MVSDNFLMFFRNSLLMLLKHILENLLKNVIGNTRPVEEIGGGRRGYRPMFANSKTTTVLRLLGSLF